VLSSFEQRQQQGEVPAQEQQDQSGTDLSDEKFDELLKKYTDLQSVDDFAKNARKVVHHRKAREHIQGFSTTVLDALLEASTIHVPKVHVDLEVEEIIDQVRSELGQQGIRFEQYLEHEKKSEEDFRKEQQEAARKRASIKILLDEIAKKEGIKVSEDEIQYEKDRMLATYKNKKSGKLSSEGKELQKKLAAESGRTYVEKNIRRDKTVSFLLEKYLPEHYGHYHEQEAIKEKE
jgi:trigger factor